jgi:hypothetical protein
MDHRLNRTHHAVTRANFLTSVKLVRESSNLKGGEIMKTIIVLLIILLASALPALAQQGYNIYTPGQTPTQVIPNGNGGYNVYTPGRAMTQILPTYNGGYNVYTPGRAPTMIQPNNNGSNVPVIRP